MRYGILADIHGNLEALEVALSRLDGEGADTILCLGDVVGYNANPAECLAKARERCSAIITGNHERMVLGRNLEGIRQETRDATEWTRDQLSAEEIAYIEALPESMPIGEHLLIVHGAPRDPDEYILSTDAIRDNMEVLRRDHPGVKVCFFGHSHFPMVIGYPDIHTRFHETRTIELDPSRLYLINPGSVGQPRDGCPKASCALYDDDAHAITIFREPYEIASTQGKIRAAGLSERLAARLELGK